MAYNFDHTPNRRIPGVSNKWTLYPDDVLPMWVADMDFQAPKPILKELHKVVDQGVLGYELPSKALQETIAARMDHLYGWKVKPEAVVTVTGIVSTARLCTSRRISPDSVTRYTMHQSDISGTARCASRDSVAS